MPQKVDKALMTLKVLGIDILDVAPEDRATLLRFLIALGPDDLEDMR